MDTDVKPEEGMVAFLDILGYSNFLQNNEPEQAASTVFQYLLGAPKNVDKFYEITFKEARHRERIKEHIGHIKWLIFSDTILLTNAYEPNESNETKGFRWFVFLITLTIIYRQLFDYGLPVRGGVSFGKFLVKKNCFAGKSIIAAFKLAHKLELAAVVLDKEVEKELDTIKVLSNYKALNSLLLNYLVPTKNQPFDKMQILVPSIPRLPRLDLSDMRQAVAESFWKHKKDLCPDVTAKLQNTELFFRFAKMRNPSLFSGEVKKKTPP